MWACGSFGALRAERELCGSLRLERRGKRQLELRLLIHVGQARRQRRRRRQPSCGTAAHKRSTTEGRVGVRPFLLQANPMGEAGQVPCSDATRPTDSWVGQHSRGAAQGAEQDVSGRRARSQRLASFKAPATYTSWSARLRRPAGTRTARWRWPSESARATPRSSARPCRRRP